MPKKCWIGILLILSACSGGKEVDKNLKALIVTHKLDAAFEADLQALPQNKALADLGAELFFSPDLSIDGSVSCASCHHPDKGGADGVALPIGIGGGDSKNVGEARIKAAEKTYSANTPKGFIPRNTPTVFNTSLYKKNVFWDGRVQYEEMAPGHKKIRTGFNVSPVNPTYYEENSLLQTQARMPLTSPFEMKGGLLPNKNNVEIEQGIIDFLRTSEHWCLQFNAVFKSENCNESITLTHLTNVLSEFQATLVFVNSPFENYIKGDDSALTLQQKKGAILFFSEPSMGGLGCSTCHSGKTFSDEKFYNLGIPASGLGTNDAGWDYGRANVDKSAIDFSFKTPSLLNITTTAPYFYNGVAATLKDAVNHHQLQNRIDKNLTIIKIPNVNYDAINAAITNRFINNNEKTISLLPKDITPEQMSDVLVFLDSLTDPCLLDKKCMSAFQRDIFETKREVIESAVYTVPENKMRALQANEIKRPVITCESPIKAHSGKGLFFSIHGKDVGLSHTKTLGVINPGWLLEMVNYGGVSVTDVNNDCLDDIIFDAGENGLVFYLQTQSGQFSRQAYPVKQQAGEVTPLIMDFDGDYKYDLFVGNMGKAPAYIVFDFMSQKNDVMYIPDLTGPVINASIADIDLDGDMDIVFAFWRTYKSIRQPHLWLNDGQGNLAPKNEGLILRDTETVKFAGGEDAIRSSVEIPIGPNDLTFTPNFTDIDNDGDQDLLLAADFHRSQIFRNDGGNYMDITDKKVIDDDNGMGAAIGDFDNNGFVDWYITSIFSQDLPGYTGNRLYKNKGKGQFSQIRENIMIKESAWSWGACAADFNNDGLLDIFYVSGFGEKLETAKYISPKQEELSNTLSESYASFNKAHPRLLINKGQNRFENISADIGLDKPLNARGVACFDYEQDGDIDIVAVPLEGTPTVFKNHLDGFANWLDVKVIGLPMNTESIGTKIQLVTENGAQYREIRFENNYLSRNSAQVHFGLGKSTKVIRLEIQFPEPNTKTVVINNPDINKIHVIYQEK